MEHLIGQKLDIAIQEITALGLDYQIIDNNFNVQGDQKLVTNIIANDKTVTLITGDFIFNIKGKSNEN